MEASGTFQHRQFAHCETGVVSALLSHYGLPISEPMVLGLAGGMNFAYLPFIKINGMPMISYRMPPRFIIRGIQGRLGVKFKTKTYRDRHTAHEELVRLVESGRPVGLQTSVYWIPYFPPDMRFQFNAHNIIVFGREDGQFLVSDPVFDSVKKIADADLQNARFAKGTLAPKGFLYYPERMPESVDTDSLIKKSIKRTTYMMLKAPPPFGIRGMRLLAGAIERLEGSRDRRYARLFLGHIVRMQEEIGTGGGGFRFMYAAFLQEGGERLNDQALREASVKMTSAGDGWRLFALACAKACRNKEGDIDFKGIAGRLRDCAEAEARVYEGLARI